jgi:hypothetical protein
VDEAFLEIARGGRRELIAVASPRYALGRSAGNDLELPEDSTVSGQHAVLERQAGGWLIRDLDSANGTRVNGLRITGPQLLSSGDVILVGQTHLSFRAGEAGPGPGPGPGPAAPPAEGYLDISEEWGHGAPPPAAGAVPDGRGRPPVPGTAHANPAHVMSVRPVSGQTVSGPAISGQPVSGPAVSAQSISAQPVSAQPVSRPPARGRAQARGTARAVQVRGSDQGKTMSFRVERYDLAGNRLPPVGVQLVGYRKGHLSDGDEVEASGKWSKGTLDAAQVTNLSTGAQILGMSGAGKAAFRLVYVLACLFIGGIALFLLLNFLGV